MKKLETQNGMGWLSFAVLLGWWPGMLGCWAGLAGLPAWLGLVGLTGLAAGWAAGWAAWLALGWAGLRRCRGLG